MLGNKLLNIPFAKYHIWNNKSEGFPNMVLSTETFNQSVRTEYSEAVNARDTFQPLWVSDVMFKVASYSFLTARNLVTRKWLMARALKLALPTRGSPTRKVNKCGFPTLQTLYFASTTQPDTQAR